MLKRNNLIILVFVLLISSCATKKEFVYFQAAEGLQRGTSISQELDIILQPDDIVAIVVSSADAEAADPFNLVRQSLNINNQPIKDYLVDSDGFIDYPGLGRVKLGGRSIRQSKEELEKLLSPFLKDVVVNVRIINFTISVLGEVARPSSYLINGENISVVEAIGLAGDITDWGDRQRLAVIRINNGKREYSELNMLSDSVFTSPYFYLKQNDIVYIPPTDGKARYARTTPVTQLFLPVASVLISLTSLIVILNNNNN